MKQSRWWCEYVDNGRLVILTYQGMTSPVLRNLRVLCGNHAPFSHLIENTCICKILPVLSLSLFFYYYFFFTFFNVYLNALIPLFCFILYTLCNLTLFLIPSYIYIYLHSLFNPDFICVIDVLILLLLILLLMLLFWTSGQKATSLCSLLCMYVHIYLREI